MRKDVMNKESFKTIVGNEAVVPVAFRLTEVIALFPITPATRWVSRRLPD
jgi:pyruvate/2-oxoacid:ferredoxin oxidoreductase alpha subunit